MPDKTQKQPQLNREAWLTQFTALALPLVRKRTGLTLPEGSYQLSCGFPSKGGTRSKNRTIGQCHIAGVGSDRKRHQIFIHPQLVDAVAVGETVLHEILHAMLPVGAGHRKPFSQAAKKLGLLPDKDDPQTQAHGWCAKATATYASAELVERIKEIADQLGEYPHESLNGFGGPKQGTRLLKVMCPLCSYTIRVTAKWIDEAGCPICPQCQISMEESGTGEQAEFPLTAIEQTTLYQVKATAEARKAAKARGQALVYDPRWFVNMQRTGTTCEWRVVDTGPAIDERGLAVFGVQPARYAKATSREDAIALLESLRDGSMTWDDIDVDDGDVDADIDVDDPTLDDPDDPEADAFEDDDETMDNPEEGADPRFQWEKDRNIPVEAIDPEAEKTKRESWVGMERGEPVIKSNEPTADKLAERVAQLSKLAAKAA